MLEIELKSTSNVVNVGIDVCCSNIDLSSNVIPVLDIELDSILLYLTRKKSI